jgi:integrase
MSRLPSGKWRAVYRGRDGRRRSITRPTKAEARDEALERESEVRRGVWRDPDLGKIAFSTWHERWLKGRVVEANTRRKNDSHIRNHIEPRWGDVPLDGVEKLDVQEWIADMQRAKVGAATIGEAVAHFGTILQAAADHGLIRGNPARGVDLPERPRQPFRILTDDEVATLLKVLTGQDERMVRLAWRLGPRWGEVTGLHGHRVVVDRRELHVVEVLTRHDGVKAYPKSKKSRRTLPFTDTDAEALKVQLDGRDPKGLVFAADNGQPLDYSNWRRRVWVPAVREAGLAVPLPTFHDLRHTCASNLIADGVDVASVQAFMGHESLLTTQRYVHAAPSARARIRAVMEARDTPATHGTNVERAEPT